MTLDCFGPPKSILEKCSPMICHADITNLTGSGQDDTLLNVKVGSLFHSHFVRAIMDCFQICAQETNSRNASIWEIDFSRSNESSQLELHFMERARERLRQLDSVPEFQDQLSFVSIVGARGVGKSTIASLLSGNSTMFKVSSLTNHNA